MYLLPFNLHRFKMSLLFSQKCFEMFVSNHATCQDAPNRYFFLSKILCCTAQTSARFLWQILNFNAAVLHHLNMMYLENFLPCIQQWTHYVKKMEIFNQNKKCLIQILFEKNYYL